MRTTTSLALLVSLGVSFIVMYGIVYSMADSWNHVNVNLSNAYMTGHDRLDGRFDASDHALDHAGNVQEQEDERRALGRVGVLLGLF